MPPRILIIYGTSYGQTEKIARRIGAGLEQRSFAVELCNASGGRGGRPALPIRDYDAVVVGSSIIATGHQPAIKDFVERNVSVLNQRPCAFFQVSASAGSSLPESRQAAQEIMQKFIDEHGWTPVLSASIAGAINYTKYNFLLKAFMKRASAKNGGSTDTSRDHEYTNWDEVDRFAAAMAREFTPAESTPASS